MLQIIISLLSYIPLQVMRKGIFTLSVIPTMSYIREKNLVVASCGVIANSLIIVMASGKAKLHDPIVMW